MIGMMQAKRHRGNGMDTSKAQIKTIDAYIDSFPAKVRIILQTLRQTIKEEVPDVEEAIRYTMPTFMLNGTYLIYFAAWKKHISLYPYTSAMEASFTEAAPYKTSGKGTIQFPIDQPLPLPLIRKIVRFRVQALSLHF
jgi:uncharacterized protein YdhG (YjbR/CyaY superfamily)